MSRITDVNLNADRPTMPASCPHFGFAVCLLIVVASLNASHGFSQSHPNVIPSPTRELLPIHLPDTSNLEQEVQVQLTAAHDTLAAAVAEHRARPTDKLSEAYGRMGDLYHAYSLLTPAMECYTNASRLAPQEFRWVYLLAKIYERKDETQKAIGVYERALILQPNYVPLLVSLGNIYLQLNRLEAAEKSFNRSIEIHEASAAAHYGLGQVALSKRRFMDAIKYFERALTLAPEANRIHYSLTLAYRGAGEIEKVKFHLARSGPVGVRAADPFVDGLQDLVQGVRLHLARGRAALEARSYTDAVVEFRKALLKQRDSIPAHFNLGAALSQTGDLRGAISEFEETLRLDPDHINAHYNLGLLLSQADRHEEAIKHLRFVVKASPGDHNARLLLAQQLVTIKRLDEADAEFVMIWKDDPENENALMGHVNVLLSEGKYVDALSALNNGHLLSPQKLVITATLAFMLAVTPKVELRDGKRALELARSVYHATRAINHGRLVAMALAELGRCDEAAAFIRQLITNASAVERSDALEKLKADLARYESARPCRPPGDATFSSQTPIQ